MPHIHIWAVPQSSSGIAHSILQNIIHAEKDTVFLWNTWPFSLPVSEHCHCLPAWCQENLPALRKDFLKFTYDLAFISHKGKALHAHLNGQDGISFYWYTLLFEKHPRLWQELYDIFKLRALELCLQKYAKGKKIILHGKTQPLYRILQEYCAVNGLELQCEEYGLVKLNRVANAFCRLKRIRKEHFLAHMPHFCGALLRFGHWCLSVKRLLPHRVFTLKQHKNAGQSVCLVTYAPPFTQDAQGHFVSSYWQDLQEYVREKFVRQRKMSLHWLCIRMRKEDMALRLALKNKDALQNKAHKEGLQEYFYFTEEFLGYKDVCRVFGQFVRMAWRSFFLEKTLKEHCHMQNLGFNYWPFTQYVWRESLRGWRGLERLLQQKSLQNYVQVMGAQAWTLFPQENCPWERMLISAVKKAQAGPIYGVQHSCVRPTDFRYFEDARFYALAKKHHLLPDAFLVNGDMAYAEYEAQHMPPKLLHKVEALRYAYLEDLQKEFATMPAPQTYKHLYILMSFFLVEAQEQLRLLADFLQNNKNAAQWQVYIKPHPFLEVHALLRDYALTQNVQIISESMQTFFQHIGKKRRQGEGVVLWCANSTTTALEAAYVGLPFCVQGARDAFDLCPLQGHKELYRIHTSLNLQNFLQNPKTLSISNNAFYLDVALSRWKKFLHCKPAQ